MSVTFYGPAGTILVTAPDGRVARDTIAPRDESCDHFDEREGAGDSMSDGIGCLSHDGEISLRGGHGGTGFVQFTTTDTGSIWFGIEAFYRRANFNTGGWPGLEFRVRKGETHIFRVALPDPRTKDTIRVVSLTGPIDTVPPPPQPR